MNRRGAWWFAVGVVITVLVAVVVSQFASGEPDGMEFVAERDGFADQVDEHVLADTPLADYGGNLETDDRVATGVAGFVGVVVALAVGLGLFWLIRAPKANTTGSSP